MFGREEEHGKRDNGEAYVSSLQHWNTEPAHFSQITSTMLLIFIARPRRNANLCPTDAFQSISSHPGLSSFYLSEGSIVKGHGITTSGSPSSKPSD